MDTDNQLLELMASNQEILSQILATDNPQDAYAIAKETIGDYSQEDFVHDFNGIQQIMYGETETEGELSLDQLETVAGGVAVPNRYNFTDEQTDQIANWNQSLGGTL